MVIGGVVRARFWVAYAALAAAIALLVPAFVPLSDSMDSFADELANGTFRPFGPTGGGKVSRTFTGSLGGLTGDSAGNYLPGAAEMPSTWVLDRDGRGGNVVIDYVFNPSLGAMKRLKAFDKVSADGETLEVVDKALRPLARDPSLRYDMRIEGSFAVQFSAGRPIPIFSVHPKAVVESARTEPPVSGLTFFRDGADTIYALANHDGIVTLNVTYLSSRDYYAFRAPVAAHPDDYPLALRPTVSAAIKDEADVVLARAGVQDKTDLGEVLTALTAYFRSFEEGPIPEPDEVESLYLALALGGNGCCRHRAFAFMVTAQAVGIPTRVVVNEAHAFVEVALPDGGWHQINLGGCGRYTVNNPENYESLFDQAEDPRGEANPDESRPVVLIQSFTNITESPSRVVKGERYVVRGTVQGPDGRGVPGARVDVFLNETKEAPGKLTGAGTTSDDGTFAISARVPSELPARGYQMVARSSDGRIGNARFAESWSDPPVDVFTPTRLAFPVLRAAVGFPANVSGRLLDVDGNAVPGVLVNWSIEGVEQQPTRTDARGGFVVRVNFTTTGDRVVVFSYAGDAHHGPAQAEAHVDVARGAILLPSEAARIDRGQPGSLSGDVAVAGIQLSNREVRVTLYRPNSSVSAMSAVGYTDSVGHFVIRATPNATLRLGPYDAIYDVPDLGLRASTLVVMTAKPRLELDAPSDVARGDSFELRATIVSDDGIPLTAARLSVYLDGNATPFRRIETDSSGRATALFPAGTLGSGDHRVRVAFDGDNTHSAVAATRFVELARPWYELVPAWAWLALLGAASLAAAGTFLVRRFERRHPRARTAAGPPRRGVVLDYPDYGALPPVAPPGGRIRVAVGLRGRDGRRLSGGVALAWPGGRAKGRAQREADAVFEVPSGDARDLPLLARGRGLARFWTRPAVAVVPVATYGEAVERGYLSLRRQAELPPSATPADLVRTLGPRVGPRAQSLADVRRLFEVAEYSDTLIDAAFYRAFARAAVTVEDGLHEPAGGSADAGG